MIRGTTLAATALLLGAGYGMAADTSSGQPGQNTPATMGPAQSGQNTPPTMTPSSSGRPSAILDNNACQNLWNSALNDVGSNSNPNAPSTSSNMSGNDADTLGSSRAGSSSTPGESLSFDRAKPYIANFAMVDKNNDRQISQAEFEDGCKKGWVQASSDDRNSGAPSSSQSSSPSPSGG